MKLSPTAAVSRVVCSEVNWMIQLGQRCKSANEVQLIGFEPHVGGTAFLNRLASHECMEIVQTLEGITLRRS